jgi:hypothetical protein
VNVSVFPEYRPASRHTSAACSRHSPICAFPGTTVVASNDNWNGDTQVSAIGARVGAFLLDGTSRDAALLVALPPGSFTAVLRGVGGTMGVALMEIYEVP